MPEFEDSEDQALFEHLRSSGYIDSVRKSAMSCSAPLFWRTEHQTLRNGSISFVSTGSEILGVTAGHVADACIEHQQRLPDQTLQVGGARFDPLRSLIERSDKWDLATFRLSEVFVNTAGRNIASVRSWPPAAPKIGDTLILGGFPAKYRHDLRSQIVIDFVSLIGQPQSANDERFGMVLDLATSIPTTHKVMPPQTDLGGFSGGPAFRLVESPFTYVELVGVVYEGLTELEILRGHPLALIAEDGHFHKH
jgi:hypothetical protein